VLPGRGTEVGLDGSSARWAAGGVERLCRKATFTQPACMKVAFLQQQEGPRPTPTAPCAPPSS
jgi:hypothetical protein